MNLDFRKDAETIAVQVTKGETGWRLQLAAAEVNLEAWQETGGAWVLTGPAGRRRMWVAAHGDERLVFCRGSVYRFRILDAEQSDEEEEGSAGPNLSADMPGKVVKVLVAVGDAVEAGQVVLIMESMKMETELVAGVTGSVQKVHVDDGQVVGQGDSLVDIEEMNIPD